MLKKFRPLIIFATGLCFFLWWFLATNRSAASYYTREEYYHDLSTIYCDLGRASFERNDFNAAIEAYKEALHLAPHRKEIHQKLALCYEQLKSPQNIALTQIDPQKRSTNALV